MIHRNKNYLIVLLVSLLFVSIATADTNSGFKEIDVSPGGKLDINCKDGGSVSISGWDKNRAEIRYSERRATLEDYDIKIEKTRSGFKIAAELNDKRINSTSLHFEIMLPRQYDVEFRTMGGGLEVEGIEGEFTGKTMGGGLTFRDCKGEVSLRTMGGAIEVVDCELDGKLHTNGGEVLVKNVVGNLRATSNGGDVRYVNVRRRDGGLQAPARLDGEDIEDITKDTVLISSMGGGIEVTDAPEGASIYTGGGEVYVRGAAKFVDAKTGGGDVDVEVTDGWIKAWTGAGDIDAEIRKGGGDTASRSIFFTGLGDVTLVLPADISVEFDIELGYTRNSTRDFKIISDFNIDQEYTDKWDYSNGSPKKHIYGTGTIAGGQHKIKIINTNGNVRITKK